MDRPELTLGDVGDLATGVDVFEINEHGTVGRVGAHIQPHDRVAGDLESALERCGCVGEKAAVG